MINEEQRAATGGTAATSGPIRGDGNLLLAPRRGSVHADAQDRVVEVTTQRDPTNANTLPSNGRKGAFIVPRTGGVGYEWRSALGVPVDPIPSEVADLTDARCKGELKPNA